jgi:hypothetical protein
MRRKRCTIAAQRCTIAAQRCTIAAQTLHKRVEIALEALHNRWTDVLKSRWNRFVYLAHWLYNLYRLTVSCTKDAAVASAEGLHSGEVSPTFADLNRKTQRAAIWRRSTSPEHLAE